MTSVEEAIATYYQKKSAYDKEYERRKETIRKDADLSVIEKREKINNIGRKCIVCEAPEGTIFSQSGRTLSAICGNRSSPCSLNINIERPSVKQFEDVIDNLKKAINKLKDNVILSKYNILFNFSQFDNAFVNKADEIRKQIKEYEDLKSKYTETYNKQFANREKLLDQEYQFLIKVDELKEIIKEAPSSYMSANEHYISVMLPMLEQIRQTKYNLIDVVRETSDGHVLMNSDKSDKGEYMRLIREPISLNNRLINVTDGVVNSIDVKKERKNKPITIKVKKTSTTTGTLKKKKLVVVSDPEISP